MKRVAILVVCLIAALPLAAADDSFNVGGAKFSQPTDLPPLDKSFATVLAELNASRTSVPRRMTPNVVLEGSEFAFVFPIAGSGAGSGGTFFRSEAVIVNRRSVAQDVSFFFFPIGGGASNCNRPSVRKRLNANTWYLYTDFVQDVFGTSGFGAVIALGVTASGATDQNALLDGNARIWTPQPGSNGGTTSQNFPSVSLSMPAGAQSTFGLRLDEFYRSNWGVFNYDTVARTFDIDIDGFRGSRQFSVLIDACSLVQQSIPGGPYGSFLMTIGARDGRALYFTYGSSVDNVTGDAWSVTGRSF
ncbi:MAG TPA: hypothetical protein VJ032_02520 [Thermoanaerobaculia bacterium]|nr:hypothetical protein [Thermoanaerobaculia bacterium]